MADEALTEAPAGSPLLAMLRASADTTVARVRLTEGRPTEALRALEPARATFEAWGTVPDRISVLLLAAAVRLAAGDRATALADLEVAVRLAAPGGYVRRFVDDGRSLLPLLGDATGATPDFATRIRAALRGDEAPQGTVRRGTSVVVAPDGTLVESLTARERDVLRLLATGARNAQVAAELGSRPGRRSGTSPTSSPSSGPRAALGPSCADRSSACSDRLARRRAATSGGSRNSAYPSRSGGARGARHGDHARMDRYEITLDAEVGERRSRDLGCEHLAPAAPGTSRLRTPPLDQAGLHGLLRSVRDAGLPLVAVSRIPHQPHGGSR